MHLQGVNWWRALLHTVQIAAGSALLALAYNLFFVPNDVVPGGVSGIAVILHHVFGWPVGLVNLALNVPLFLIGLRWGGGVNTGLRTAWAVTVFSVAVDWMPLPLEPITQSPVLYVTYGGLLSGAGVALVYLAQGTLGGTNILGRLLPLITPLTVSQSIFIADGLVIVAAAFVFGLEAAMFGLMVTAVGAWALDTVLAGGRRSLQALVISGQWQAVRDALLNDLHRGVTVLNGQGGFSGDERTLLLVIINRSEAARLRHLVRAIDPGAFVMVTPTSEVWGAGFGLSNGEA